MQQYHRSALGETEANDTATISTLQIGLEWFPDGIGGGSSRFFSTITDYLRAERVGVRGIAAGRAATTDVRRDGIRIICPSDAPIMGRLRAARSAVRDILTKDGADIVASHFALFTFASLDVISRLPLVVHFHGPWSAESRVEGASPLTTSSQFIVEKVVYQRAERAIVLTRAFRDVLHQRYGVPNDKIRVIPGGVDLTLFNLSASRAEARTRLRLPLDRPIILVVRRLAKRMGLERLLASFADLGKDHRDAVLVIVGGGHLLDMLKRRVHEYGLSTKVIFAGRVPEEDLPLYYRAADISIVPSTALEGFGLVVAESLACGTPPLVTPVGGLPEVVSGLSERLILEDSGCGAITRGLREALAGRLQLPSAEICAAYARASFSWPTIAKQVKAVYEEVL